MKQNVAKMTPETTTEIQAIINLATKFIHELELIKKEAISKLPPKTATTAMFFRNPLTGEETFYDKNNRPIKRTKTSNCGIDPEGRRLRLHDHRKGGQP
jgi:hypothetical protein